MSIPNLHRRILGRRSVRTRIALACAGLFLVTGGILVAATYTIVARSLSNVALTDTESKVAPSIVGHVGAAGVQKFCKSGLQAGKIVGSLAAQCKKVFASAAGFGASYARGRDLHELLLWSLVGLGVATVVAGFLGWAIGWRILLPLQKVTGAARRASQEHLDERIRLGGPQDELKDLADTFDDMLNRLDLAFASQRRFVANASHELRTPLTSMRTLIDVALAKPARNTEQLEAVVRQVREAVDQSEAIIDGLLTLARSDRGLTSREPLDLEAAAQDAIDQSGAEARASDILIEADLSAAPTLGDRVLVERLAANLVDNAVRYNVPAGWVQVETGIDDGQSFLSVTNSGPVVPEAKLASLFEPFTRLDERVNDGHGVGLGLSIVASVVATHRGQLDAEALPGGGLKIAVRFPTEEWRQPEDQPAGGPERAALRS
ncbi:MAG: ATP-binding protein [Acidimicrobiaceae bacterium]|nr:ATP-binding protein [Acidimicrobiaceae bacterium]